MVYKTATDHSTNDGILHIKFSDDYGSTWSNVDKYIGGASVTGFPMNPPDLGAGEDCQEPWLMTAPNGDLLLHMWKDDYGVTQHGTWQSRSTDGGQSWTTPVQISPTGLTGPDQMFATDDHFVYDGVLYVGARYFSADWVDAKVILIKSTDSGVTWSYVSTIAGYTPLAVEVGIEYIDNNNIIAVIRGDNDLSWITYSHDMGLTWDSVRSVMDTIYGSGRHRIKTAAHIRQEANWWTDPVLIMTGYIPMAGGRSLIMWISEDKGNTWAMPFVVATVTGDTGYGDIFYNPNTSKYIYLSYYGSTSVADIKQYNLTLGL